MSPGGPGGAPAGVTPPDRLDNARGAAFVARAVAEADPSRYLSVSLRVPRVDPIVPLGMDGSLDCFYWRDRDGRLLAGLGDAALITAHGGERMRAVRERAAAIGDRLDRHVFGGDRLPPLPFFGGFAFAPGAADAEPWAGFGDARFVLPEIAYFADGDEAWLTLTAAPAVLSHDAAREAALARFGGVLERVLAADDARAGAAPDAEVDPEAGTTPGAEATAESGHISGAVSPLSEDTARARFVELAAAALERLAQGRVEKIVIARSARLAVGDARLAPLLDRLRRAVGTYRFALAVDGRVFLGATPERLVARERDVARTEALAGTAMVAYEETPLEASEKDRLEHAIVVQSIAETIGPLCTVVGYDPAPVERRAGELRHLSTAFECTVREGTHVLDLVERLHPTPAVGGRPRDTAVEWIRRHETTPRGWYASPIGWFDAHGAGEFAVALRCGVLRGDALELFAGAGIVPGSRPEAEYEETVWKLRALPTALGLVP